MTERRDPQRDEPMREQDPEQLLADWFREDAPVKEPPVLLPAVLARTALTRRRRKWFTRDWWLSVLGLIDRRPPSMMVSVGFIAILTSLTLTAAFVVGSGDTDDDGAYVVDQRGDGDFTTIAEAVEVAVDGDTITVRPGTYDEDITIMADIALLGESEDRVDVILTGLTLTGAEAEIGYLTVLTSEGEFEATAVTISGGAPELHHVEGAFYMTDGTDAILRDSNVTHVTNDQAALVIRGTGTVVHMDGNLIVGGVVIEGGADATLEGNDIDLPDDGLHCGVLVLGSHATLRAGNRVHDSNVGICVAGGASATIDGNEISGNLHGILVSAGSTVSINDNRFIEQVSHGVLAHPRSSTDIRGNVFEVNQIGIEVSEHGDLDLDWGQADPLSTSVSITDNEFDDQGSASIVLDASLEQVEANMIRASGGDGIQIERDTSPTLTGNSVSGAARGIFIGSGATPTLIDNRVCDNETNLAMGRSGADPVLIDNEICEDPDSAASE